MRMVRDALSMERTRVRLRTVTSLRSLKYSGVRTVPKFVELQGVQRVHLSGNVVWNAAAAEGNIRSFINHYDFRSRIQPLQAIGGLGAERNAADDDDTFGHGCLLSPLGELLQNDVFRHTRFRGNVQGGSKKEAMSCALGSISPDRRRMRTHEASFFLQASFCCREGNSLGPVKAATDAS